MTKDGYQIKAILDAQTEDRKDHPTKHKSKTSISLYTSFIVLDLNLSQKIPSDYYDVFARFK